MGSQAGILDINSDRAAILPPNVPHYPRALLLRASRYMRRLDPFGFRAPDGIHEPIKEFL